MINKLLCFFFFGGGVASVISSCMLSTGDGCANRIAFYMLLFLHLSLYRFNIGKSGNELK